MMFYQHIMVWAGNSKCLENMNIIDLGLEVEEMCIYYLVGQNGSVVGVDMTDEQLG